MLSVGKAHAARDVRYELSQNAPRVSLAQRSNWAAAPYNRILEVNPELDHDIHSCT